MIPKSGQEVMITMVKSHFKNRLTFARAPCKLKLELCPESKVLS